MSFNLFSQTTKDDIKVGYINPDLGYVDGLSICEANDYAKDNPGTTFIFRDGGNGIQYININEVNRLTPSDLVPSDDKCGGIQDYSDCSPPSIQFFGGGGIGAVGNPVIGSDGSLLAVDLVSGGHGYQYPPKVVLQDKCEIGNGVVLTAVLGKTVDQIEVYEGEEDYEEYELCSDLEIGYGAKYGINGELLGDWEPNLYTRIGADPIKREIELFQKALKNPFWTTREKQPDRITVLGEQFATQEITNVTFPTWGEFMNKYAVSPVKPSDTKGTDEAGKIFTLEWELNFPVSGEYIFRGVCDNVGQVFVDNSLVGNLNGFDQNPSPLKKTIEEGNHIVRVELVNSPVVLLTETKVSNTVDVTFKITGRGRNTNLMKFSFVSDTYSFTLRGNQKSGDSKSITVKLNQNSKFKVFASSSKGTVEQGIIKNGTKNKEGGDGESNRIFADHIQSDNDNDDIQITASVGSFIASNKSSTPEGRSTFKLKFDLGSGGDGSSSTTSFVESVVSPESWNTNPMGVSMIIDSPTLPIPQEALPIPEGECPPNPIWSTRFPGASQQWYPVRFDNGWSSFMNRYALSPIPPLGTPGSDIAGTTFSNSWQINLPYAGFYGVKGTKDNSGRLLIDGEKISSLSGFNSNNPSLSKVYLTKGSHTITVEVSNKPVQIDSVIDKKIFSTQDWRVPASQEETSDSKLKPSFVLQGSNVYLQVDGSGTGEITFNMSTNDNPFIAGIAAREVVIPSDGGSVRLKRDPFKENGNDNGTGKFKAGKKYGPIQIIGSGPGARGPIVNSKNRLGLRDADSDDENIKITIAKTKSDKSSATVATSQSPTKDGVVYEGPELFGYNETRWSQYMNDFSVSPKVFKSIGEEDTAVVGKYALTWKNVNFPESGTYKFNFQADNIAKLKIGGVEILETSDFTGNKIQYTFNLTAGNYDIVIELENLKTEQEEERRKAKNRKKDKKVKEKGGKDDFIFSKNPMGAALFISKDVIFSEDNKTSWTTNPIGISAILIPPPCAKKIGGRGIVADVVVEEPGNGYPQSPSPGYPVVLILDRVEVENPGINYNCGSDQIQITPSNGAVLDYGCDSFGRITSVKVLNPGSGFAVYPAITISSSTGVNAKFRPIFRVVRDPVQLLEDQLIKQEQIIQVTDLVGLKQTGYVDGRAYYGAIYYDDGGIPYAGYYETVGTPVRVYNTLQESITAQVTAVPSAIQRSGTDVTSNNPRLNIPGTPQSTTE